MTGGIRIELSRSPSGAAQQALDRNFHQISGKRVDPTRAVAKMRSLTTCRSSTIGVRIGEDNLRVPAPITRLSRAVHLRKRPRHAARPPFADRLVARPCSTAACAPCSCCESRTCTRPGRLARMVTARSRRRTRAARGRGSSPASAGLCPVRHHRDVGGRDSAGASQAYIGCQK